MNRLFIELYLDEDVDVLVAELLRAHGFVAVTASEAGQLGKSDADQLAYAAGRTHYGIILAGRRSAYEIVRRLLLILNSVTADEIQNQVRWI